MATALANDHFQEATVRMRAAPVLALSVPFSKTALESSRRDCRVSRTAETPLPVADATRKAALLLDRAFLSVL